CVTAMTTKPEYLRGLAADRPKCTPAIPHLLRNHLDKSRISTLDTAQPQGTSAASFAPSNGFWPTTRSVSKNGASGSRCTTADSIPEKPTQVRKRSSSTSEKPNHRSAYSSRASSK